jgi:membrane-associated phospholipid phosphatase
VTARGPDLRALAAAVGLVAVTATVVAGGATRLDQYAVDHWIHGLERGDADSPLLSVHQLYPHLGTPLEAACSLWTFPGSALVSGLVLVAGCWLLARRGRRDAALAWAAAWIVANALEVLGKGLLERPALRFDGGVLHNFDSSFPSGHALRAVLAAALVAAVWPRAALPAALWAAVVLPALVVNGDHTPSDVVGGALLALFAAAAVATWLAARAPARGEASRRIALRSAVAEDG